MKLIYKRSLYTNGVYIQMELIYKWSLDTNGVDI